MSPQARLLDPELRLQHARDLAWAALNRREHTTAELQRVLERKQVEPELIAEVIGELVTERWLDDAGYARRFAEDRRNLDGWGSERIERRLRALGVDSEHIEAALGSQPAEDEMEAAVGLLRRRFPEPPSTPRDVHRALGVLVRKGYSVELSHDAIRRHADVGEFDEA